MINNYKFIALIGQGYSSQVFRAVKTQTNEKCAIKVITKNTNTEVQSLLINNEVTILQNIQCPNIIRLIEIIQEEDKIFIITELCEFGSLEDQLKRKKEFDESQCLIFLYQMTNALMVLKRNQLVHNDIKPSNIFITSNGYKLADFGFAFKTTTQFQFNLGTPYYMSPETLISNHHTYQSDIWSLGVTLYQIIEGKLPYQAQDEKGLIAKMLHSKPTFSCAPRLQRILTSMFEIDPSKRASVEQLQTLFVEKENQKPQRLKSLHAEKSPFRSNIKQHALSICQLARELRMNNSEDELLAYALQGIIIYYSRTNPQLRQPDGMIIEKKRVPNIFSMAQEELLQFCITQLGYSIQEYGQYIKTKVNENNLSLNEDCIVNFINLHNLYKHIRSRDESKLMKWVNTQITYEYLKLLLQQL